MSEQNPPSKMFRNVCTSFENQVPIFAKLLIINYWFNDFYVIPECVNNRSLCLYLILVTFRGLYSFCLYVMYYSNMLFLFKFYYNPLEAYFLIRDRNSERKYGKTRRMRGRGSIVKNMRVYKNLFSMKENKLLQYVTSLF